MAVLGNFSKRRRQSCEVAETWAGARRDRSRIDHRAKSWGTLEEPHRKSSRTNEEVLHREKYSDSMEIFHPGEGIPHLQGKVALE